MIHTTFGVVEKIRTGTFLTISENQIMKRNDFVKRIAVIAIGAPFLLTAKSCSKDEDEVIEPTPPAPVEPKDCLANGTNVTVGSNHGHSLFVSASDISAGVDKTYSIQGSSGHNHSVTITAAHFASLKNNSSVGIASSSGAAHTHTVTVSCAS